MAEHNALGIEGEKMAVAWLENRGYEIMQRNWRYSYYEIDIIALKGAFLHFIEIKTRSDQRFGLPEDSVGKEKMKRLRRAANNYLFLHPGHKWIQFDILSITMMKNEEPEYFLLEDIS